MIQTTEYQKKQSMFKYLTTFILVALFSLVFIIPVYAEDPGGDAPDIGLGGGWDSSGGTTHFDWGYSAEAGGYRCYMEDEGGSVVQQVIDLYFADPTQITEYMVERWTTAIGYKQAIKENQISYYKSGIADIIPGLRPPFESDGWGEELDHWFESYNNSNGQVPNAILFIGSVFESTDDTDKLVAEYSAGRYRIVVEAIYYLRLVNYSQGYVTVKGQKAGFYGTVRNLAQYLWRQDVAPVISETPYYGGGKWLGSLTNGTFATGVQLVETDEFSGFGPPVAKTGNKSGEGGLFVYSDLIQARQGWGMDIIYRDKIEEKWATYDATAYGGTKGQSPGKAPEMPPFESSSGAEWRQVTIIKYYEEYVMTDSGRPKPQLVQGPHKQTKICRTIEVQEEPGWTLQQYTQTKNDGNWALYENIGGQLKHNNGFQATTVEVDIDNGYKYLVIEYTRAAEETTPAPDLVDDELEMELFESEISKAYITNTVKDNTEPKLQFSWSNPHLATNEYCWTESVMTDPGGDPITDPLTGQVIGYTGPSYSDVRHNHDFNWQDSSLTLKVQLDTQKYTAVKKILGTVGVFAPKLNVDGNESKTVDAKQTQSADVEDFNANFTIWRGEDQPTVNAYKQQAGASAVDDLLDATQAANKDQGKRKDSADVAQTDRYYTTNLTIYFKPDNSGDYTLSQVCQLGRGGGCDKGGSDTVNIFNDNSQNYYTFTGPVTVDYFNGDPNQPVTKIKQSAEIIRRYPAYDNVQFYPYVQMSYQTQADAGTTNGGIVYVLGSYQREFKAAAALKLTWKESYYPGTKYSMIVRSDQWSTHATALQRYGKNILLPGGAIYQVTTNPGGGTTLGGTLTLEAWYPDIIDDYQNGIVSKPSDWTGSNGESEFQALVGSARNNIQNNSRLEFRVAQGVQTSASSGIQVTGGTDLQALGHNGLKASTDSKYLINSDDIQAANSRRASVTASQVAKTEIKVIANPDGKVEIGGGGGTLAKDKGADSLPSNSAAKKADDYTSLIQNFISQLQRNAGHDTETTFGNYWAKSDGAWYNEAFGFKVNYYKATIKVAVPANDGINEGGVTAVLDPNLGPTQNGTAQKFDSVNTGQFFMMLNNRILGTFGQQTVSFPNTSGGYLLSSQPFYIAAYSVQDND